MSREIEVIIEKDGTVKIEALGYEGQGCEQDLRKLQQLLGKLKEEQAKPEFYRGTVNDQNRLRG